MSEPRINPVATPHFLGVILSCMLYGFTLAQTWYYFRSFPKDGRHIKLLVAFLCTLGTTQIILVSASLHQYTITWAGELAKQEYATLTFEASMGVSSVIAFTVQLSYAHRIWRLSSHNRFLTAPVVVLACIALGLGETLLAESLAAPKWDDTQGSNVTALIFFISSIACDLLIAGSQVYLFRRSKSHMGRLGGLITRLTILVVNIGLLTSIDVAVFFILFLVCPSGAAYLVPYILMGHFYLNSFLGVLNSRLLLRELIDSDAYTCPNVVPCSLHTFAVCPPSETQPQCPALSLSTSQPQTSSQSQSNTLSPSGDDTCAIALAPRV